MPRRSSPPQLSIARGIYGGVVEAAAFGVELALLVTLAASGTGVGRGLVVHVALGILLPGLAAGIWAVWMAPTSQRRLADPRRLAWQVVLFLATAVLAVAVGRVVWGVVFGVVSITVFSLARTSGGVTGSASARESFEV
jgi:uncharacterized protein DUF2568